MINLIKQTDTVKEKAIINNKNNTEYNPKTSEQVKNGKKKLILALIATGAVAAAVIAIKRRPVNIEKFKEIGSFENGMALVNNFKGSKRGYNGTVKVVSKNGDVTFIKYVNGLIQKSVKKSQNGQEIFNKTYKHSLTEGKSVISYAKTEKSDKITEFFKNQNGHIIKENGIIKKAFIEKDNGEKIVADFIEGKPFSSLKYKIEANGEKTLLSTKNYYVNGKIREIKSNSKKIVFAKENGTFPFNSDSMEIKFDEQFGAKNIVYVKSGNPVCQKDIECNLDYVPNVRTQGDFKTAKHINTYIFNEDTPFEKVGDELFGGRKIEEKYLYSNGASDIVREGCLSHNNPSSVCEVEHVNQMGKTTGFSRVEFSKDYLRFNVGDRFNTRITEYPCSHKEYDENHKLIDAWFGLVKCAWNNNSSNLELP